MPDILRSASAVWTGDLRGGAGTVSSESGALNDAGFKFVTRFENEAGSNPEELIAAAQAACFSMALSSNLGKNGTPPGEIRTKATLTLHKGDAGFKITAIHLETVGTVAGVDAATFQTIAEQTKNTCPVSVLLKPGLESMTVTAKLA